VDRKIKLKGFDVKIKPEINVPDGNYCNYNVDDESDMCTYYRYKQCLLFNKEILLDLKAIHAGIKTQECIQACKESENED